MRSYCIVQTLERSISFMFRVWPLRRNRLCSLGCLRNVPIWAPPQPFRIPANCSPRHCDNAYCNIPAKRLRHHPSFIACNAPGIANAEAMKVRSCVNHRRQLRRERSMLFLRFRDWTSLRWCWTRLVCEACVFGRGGRCGTLSLSVAFAVERWNRC